MVGVLSYMLCFVESVNYDDIVMSFNKYRHSTSSRGTWRNVAARSQDHGHRIWSFPTSSYRFRAAHHSQTHIGIVLPKSRPGLFPLVVTMTSKSVVSSNGVRFDLFLGYFVVMNVAQTLGWKHYSGALWFRKERLLVIWLCQLDVEMKHDWALKHALQIDFGSLSDPFKCLSTLSQD